MRLGDYLKSNSLSDEAFAALSEHNFSAEAVRKWRFGSRIPRPRHMQRILQITGGQVEPNDFVDSAREVRA